MSDILSQILAQGDKIRESISQSVTRGASDISAANENQRAALADSTQASVEQEKLAMQEDQAKLAARNNVANQLGVGNDMSQRADLATKILQAKDQMAAAHSEQLALASTNFADDPLNWIISQIKLPFATTAAKAATDNFTSLTSAYTSLDTAAQNGFQTVNQLNEADAAAKFNAKVKMLNAVSAGKDAELQRQNALDGLSAAKEIGNLALNQNAQQFQVAQARQAQSNADRQFALEQERFNMMRADKAKKDQYYQILKLGLAAHYPEEQRANIMALPEIALERAVANNDSLEKSAYNLGMQIIAKGNGNTEAVRWGATPAETANIMDQTSYPKNMQWLQDAKKSFSLESAPKQATLGVSGDQIIMQSAMGADGRKTAVSPQFDAAVNKWLLTKSKNVDPRDRTNPFLAPALSQVISTDPQVGQIPVVRDFLVKLGPAGNTLIQDPKALVESFWKTNPNYDTIEFSKQLSTLYSRIRAHTNAVSNFQGAGVSQKILTTGYSVDGIDYSQPQDVALQVVKTKMNQRQGWNIPELSRDLEDLHNATYNTDWSIK